MSAFQSRESHLSTMVELEDERGTPSGIIEAQAAFIEDDPLALTFKFKSGDPPTWVDWTLARRLIEKAVESPPEEVIGQGDVKFKKEVNLREQFASRYIIRMMLNSPEGVMDALFDADELEDFVDDTFSIVSPAEEQRLVSEALQNEILATL